MIDTLKNYVLSYALSGVKNTSKDETNRRIMVVNLFAAVGVSITFILGVRALWAAEFGLATLLLIACLIFALSQRVQAIFQTPMARTASMTMIICCLMGLVLALLITGGKDNTGPLWMYLVPPVTMFFSGFVRGLLALVAFTLVCALLFFVFDDTLISASYSYAFKSRLLYSFMTVSFLSALYEYSRQRSYNTALHLSEQFEQQANHDYLTQLMNRRGVQAVLEREFARVQRRHHPFTIAIADVDHFKNINDTLGHEKGDEVLVSISSIFQNRLRKQDVLARWGGEEFMFVFPDTKGEDAKQVLEELRRTLSESMLTIGEVELEVTSSFGACEVNEDTSVSDAIREADSALYSAKECGRNNVILKTDE